MRIRMTDDQSELAFRLMWYQLAKSGGTAEDKYSIPSIKWLEKHRVYLDKALNQSRNNACFACGEAVARSGEEGRDRCLKCPIDWGEEFEEIKPREMFPCIWGDVLYNQWDTEEDSERRKALALQIAELPWKPRKK